MWACVAAIFLRDIPTVDADPGTYYFHGTPAVAEYTHYFAIGKAIPYVGVMAGLAF